MNANLARRIWPKTVYLEGDPCDRSASLKQAAQWKRETGLSNPVVIVQVKA